MADFTIDDTTIARIRYELDDREIYNDIRSEIAVLASEKHRDPDDPFYNFALWRWSGRALPGETLRLIFTAYYTSAQDWAIVSHSARHTIYFPDYSTTPYYDYNIYLETVEGDRKKALVIENTGDEQCDVTYILRYRYLASERIITEPLISVATLARAYDAESIRKYGRRVMNLTWQEGTNLEAMQTIVDFHLRRYKEPVARLPCVIRGLTDTLRTQIITREISDIIAVNYTNLGFDDDCFLESISIKDDVAGQPTCKWGLTAMRDYEKSTLFALDTSELDGPDILGS